MDAASDSPGPGARLPLASLGGQGQPVSAIDVLWITAGLGCDGDTIAMTAATQPSIEDVVLGGIPWIPKVHLHNPFLACRKRRRFSAADSTRPPRAKSTPSSWCRRLDPRRDTIRRRLLGILGHRPGDRPAHHHLRMDRPARAACLGGHRGGNLRDLRRHPRHGRQSNRLHGPARLSRLAMEIQGRTSPSCAFPAARFSRITSWRRCSICSTWPRAARP